MKVGLLTAHASRRAAGVWPSVERLGRALAQNAVEVEIFGLVDASSGVDDGQAGAPPPNLHPVIGSAAFGYAPGLGAALEAGRLCCSTRTASGCIRRSRA